MDFYKKIQNKYGLPLDNRQTYTKLDWILWTATLTQNRADFEALVDPVYLFLNETPDRSPMTDWYFTNDARKRGFTARPVVGGVFLQMLYDKAVWKKYAGRDKTKAANWAPMPKPPVLVTVVPTAQDEPATWRYTTQTARPTAGSSRSSTPAPGRKARAASAPRHARRGRAHRVEHAGHLAAPRVHAARGQVGQHRPERPPRRGRRDLHQRRAGRHGDRLHDRLRAAAR